MRECWVLEEHSKGDGWYPLRCAGSKEAAEAEMRSWPASTLYPKRVVRYVPEPGEEDAHLRSIVELYRSDPMAMADALWRMREQIGALRLAAEDAQR